VTFADWWRALLARKLRWRWHYLIYLALWGHALWRTCAIVVNASRSAPPAAARSDEL